MKDQDQGDGCLDAPPLFTPHVFIAERNETSTFGSSGYMMPLSRFMVSEYDSKCAILLLAKKYNLQVTWKRVLEVLVHEARNLEPKNWIYVHDVRCKVVVGSQIGRTKIVDSPVWNETLKFHVDSSCNIHILLYCKNWFLPNEKVGRVSIEPNRIVERSTVTEWYPLDTRGELKLSFTLSAPSLAPFKFTMQNNVSYKDCPILDSNGEKIFTVIGRWPHSISLLDYKDFSILNIKNCVNELQDKEFNLYLYGHTSPLFSFSWYKNNSGSGIKVEGLPSISSIVINLYDFDFYSNNGFCMGSAKLSNQYPFLFISLYFSFL
jgi:hypothetical protein